VIFREALGVALSEVAPENTPKNEKYILPDVRKNILSIYARKVQKSIREELKIASYFQLPLYLNRGSTPA
jgi:hypothetical protein